MASSLTPRSSRNYSGLLPLVDKENSPHHVPCQFLIQYASGKNLSGRYAVAVWRSNRVLDKHQDLAGEAWARDLKAARILPTFCCPSQTSNSRSPTDGASSKSGVLQSRSRRASQLRLMKQSGGAKWAQQHQRSRSYA